MLEHPPTSPLSLYLQYDQGLEAEMAETKAFESQPERAALYLGVVEQLLDTNVLALAERLVMLILSPFTLPPIITLGS